MEKNQWFKAKISSSSPFYLIGNVQNVTLRPKYTSWLKNTSCLKNNVIFNYLSFKI